MAELTYRDAVAAGIAQEMARDERVVFLGEDVAAAGGVFKATVGLLDQFGPKRVRDCPISEQAILGAAMGAAMTGLRPIAEIMFSDFLAVCWDIVANEIAKTRYMTNGQITLPLEPQGLTPELLEKVGVEIGAHRIIDGMSQEVHIGIGD